MATFTATAAQSTSPAMYSVNRTVTRVVERSFAVGQGNTIEIYEVKLQGATDISKIESLTGLSEEQFKAIVPTQKRLVLDLDSLKLPNSDGNHPTGTDNIEGIAFGPKLADGRQSIVLVSDNNFGAAQFTQVIALAANLKPTAITPAKVIPGTAKDDLLDAKGKGCKRLYGGRDKDRLFAGTKDYLFGGDGNDSLFAGKGGNTLFGGAGADKFYLATGSLPTSVNTVSDFEIGIDKLLILGIADTTDFSKITLTQQGNNTLVKAGGKDISVLTGIRSSDLNSSNFSFI